MKYIKTFNIIIALLLLLSLSPITSLANNIMIVYANEDMGDLGYIEDGEDVKDEEDLEKKEDTELEESDKDTDYEFEESREENKDDFEIDEGFTIQEGEEFDLTDETPKGFWYDDHYHLFEEYPCWYFGCPTNAHLNTQSNFSYMPLATTSGHVHTDACYNHTHTSKCTKVTKYVGSTPQSVYISLWGDSKVRDPYEVGNYYYTSYWRTMALSCSACDKRIFDWTMEYNPSGVWTSNIFWLRPGAYGSTRYQEPFGGRIAQYNLSSFNIYNSGGWNTNIAPYSMESTRDVVLSFHTYFNTMLSTLNSKCILTKLSDTSYKTSAFLWDDSNFNLKNLVSGVPTYTRTASIYEYFGMFSLDLYSRTNGTNFIPGCLQHGNTAETYLCDFSKDIAICSQVVKDTSSIKIEQTNSDKFYINGTLPSLKATVTMLDGSTKVYTTGFNTNWDSIKTSTGAKTLQVSIPNIKVGSGSSSATTLTGTLSITVESSLIGVTATTSTPTVYKATNPLFTIKAQYNGKPEVTLFNNVAFSVGKGVIMTGLDINVIGKQTAKFSYTENGVTKEATVPIIVKPNVKSLSMTVRPITGSIYYYDEDIVTSFIVTYEDNTTANVNASVVTAFNKNKLGTQTIKYRYTENNKSVETSTDITVFDYITSAVANFTNNSIIQTQREVANISIVTKSGGNYTYNFPSGTTSLSGVTVSSDMQPINYDKVGSYPIVYTLSYNGKSIQTVSNTLEIKPDLVKITTNKKNFEVFKGNNIKGIDVTATYNLTGNKKLAANEYTIVGFNTNTPDKAGKDYNIEHTNKGVIAKDSINIKVIPNVTNIDIIMPNEIVEQEDVPLTAKITYEDGSSRTVLKGSNLKLLNYNPDKIGEQSVKVVYTEADTDFTYDKVIRTRAIINVSIPTSLLFNYNPNNESGILSLKDYKIESSTREDIEVKVLNIESSNAGFNNVLPSKYFSWGSALGQTSSKDLAFGVKPNSNWKRITTSSLYAVNATKPTVLGVINAGSTSNKTVSTFDFDVRFGNAFNTNKEVNFKINWSISLLD